MTNQISPSPFEMQSLPARRLTGKPYTYYAVRDRRNCCVAIVGQVDAIHDDGEAEANARLFRAAPELLEQLKQTVSSLEYMFPRYGDPEGVNSQMMKNARALIAQLEK